MDCCSNVARPVFVESNLGTRLAAVPGSPDITAKEFKSEAKITFLPFIRVYASQICFSGFKRRLVSANGCTLHRALEFQQNKESRDTTISVPCNDLCTEKKKEERKRKRKMLPKRDVTVESRNETFSESVSVSRIIKKYFSDDDEVESTPYSTVRTRNKRKNYLNRETQHSKHGIGKRLLLASDNLGLNLSDQRALISLCRSSNRKFAYRGIGGCSSGFSVRDDIGGK